MILQDGRDTEVDLLGNHGNYKTILSKNTLNNPCPQCGNTIIKDTSSGGGAVYYCPVCQKINDAYEVFIKNKIFQADYQ